MRPVPVPVPPAPALVPVLVLVRTEVRATTTTNDVHSTAWLKNRSCINTNDQGLWERGEERLEA